MAAPACGLQKSLPSLQIDVVDQEPVEMFGEGRTRELKQSPMISLLLEEAVHCFFQGP